MTPFGTGQASPPEGMAPDAGAAPRERSGGLEVAWALTPPAGRGLDLRWGWVDTPFGDAFAVCTGTGLAGLGFADELGRESVRSHYMERRWPEARWREDRAAARKTAGWPPGRLHLMGTPFQRSVWRALLAIPEGLTATYADIARRIGRPKGVRAVGGAVGANPVSWFVPCHRVVGSSGGLTGYGWGLSVKRAMLTRESALPGKGSLPPAR